MGEESEAGDSAEEWSSDDSRKITKMEVRAIQTPVFAWVNPTGKWSMRLNISAIFITVIAIVLGCYSLNLIDVPENSSIPELQELPDQQVEFFKMDVEVEDSIIASVKCHQHEDSETGAISYRKNYNQYEGEKILLKNDNDEYFTVNWDTASGGDLNMNFGGSCYSGNVGRVWYAGDGYAVSVLVYIESEETYTLLAASDKMEDMPEVTKFETWQRTAMLVFAIGIGIIGLCTPTYLSQQIKRLKGNEDRGISISPNFVTRGVEEKSINYDKMLKKDLIEIADSRGIIPMRLKKEIVEQLIESDEKIAKEVATATSREIMLKSTSTTRRGENWIMKPKPIETWDTTNLYAPDLDEKILDEHPENIGSPRPPMFTNSALLISLSIITFSWLASDLIGRHHDVFAYFFGVILRIISITVAVIWLFASFWKWIILHSVIDTPTQLIRSAAVGGVEICGQTRPSSDNTLSISLGSNKFDGLLAYYWIEETKTIYRDNRGNLQERWNRTDSGKAHVDSFIVHDGTAGIKIDGPAWFGKYANILALSKSKKWVSITLALVALISLLIGFYHLDLDDGGSSPLLLPIASFTVSGILVVYLAMKHITFIREPIWKFYSKIKNPKMLIDFGETLHSDPRLGSVRYDIWALGAGDPVYIIGEIGTRTSEDMQKEYLSGENQSEHLIIRPRERIESSILRRGTELSLLIKSRSTTETIILPCLALISAIIPFFWT